MKLSTATLHTSKDNATNVSVGRNSNMITKSKADRKMEVKFLTNALKLVTSGCCYVNKIRSFLLIQPQFTSAPWLCYLHNGSLEENNS